MKQMKSRELFVKAMLFGVVCLNTINAYAQNSEVQQRVTSKLDSDYPALDVFYKELHTHPELS